MINIEDLFNKYANLLQFEEGAPEYLVDKEDFKAALKEFGDAIVDKCADVAEHNLTESKLFNPGKPILRVKKCINYGKTSIYRKRNRAT